MSKRNVVEKASAVALLLSIAACGSGTGDNATSSEPLAGAANGITDASSRQVAGRVADGYIQGATVCVDLNENEACDADEPSSVTGEGGIYELQIPAGAGDKPIVADIPAEAIDEDTGEAIGQALVFVAPADKPEFLSPITTLVHQALKKDPDLKVDDAESIVKAELGIDDDTVSLFTDYVEGGRGEGEHEGKEEKFRHMHDTARVMASMMKDIEKEVAVAAMASGMDVEGDREIRRAIREIVRSEIRDMLPSIASEVAQLNAATASAVADTGSVQSGTLAVDTFDPDELAVILRPEGSTDDIENRIDAVKDHPELVQADVKQLLTDGMYWLEMSCMEDYSTYQVTSMNEEATLVDAAGMTVDSELQAYDLLEYQVAGDCQAYYGRIVLNVEDNSLLNESYRFDQLSGSWVLDVDMEEVDYPYHYVLVDGEWIAGGSLEPTGIVEFTADGGAIVSTEGGEILMTANTQSLDGLTLGRYFHEDDQDDWQGVDELTAFPAGSEAYRVRGRMEGSPYVLFNMSGLDESGNDICALYNGNCNVVNAGIGDQSYALTSLEEVREASISGLDVSVQSGGFGPNFIVNISAEATADGSLPTGGTVDWSIGELANLTVTDVSDTGVGETVTDTTIILPGGTPLEGPVDPLVEGPVDPRVEEPAIPLNDDSGYAGYDEYYSKDEAVTWSSNWELVEVQGVAMIRIEMPMVLRYDDEGDAAGTALMLTVQDGFVRMAMEVPQNLNERIITYNETAFVTLKTAVESAMAAQ